MVEAPLHQRQPAQAVKARPALACRGFQEIRLLEVAEDRRGNTTALLGATMETRRVPQIRC